MLERRMLRNLKFKDILLIVGIYFISQMMRTIVIFFFF